MGDVKYLLDTHTLLWAVREESKLGKRALSVLEDINSHFYVSSVSAYEIMQKYRIGKLSGYSYIAEHYYDVVNNLGAHELPINTRHAWFAGKFEWSHRDPFDRLLAAQAKIENLTLITNDEVFLTLSWANTLW